MDRDKIHGAVHGKQKPSFALHLSFEATCYLVPKIRRQIHKIPIAFGGTPLPVEAPNQFVDLRRLPYQYWAFDLIFCDCTRIVIFCLTGTCHLNDVEHGFVFAD